MKDSKYYNAETDKFEFTEYELMELMKEVKDSGDNSLIAGGIGFLLGDAFDLFNL